MRLECPGRRLYCSVSFPNLLRKKTRLLRLKTVPKMLQSRKKLKTLLNRSSQRRTKKKRTRNSMVKKMTIWGRMK